MYMRTGRQYLLFLSILVLLVSAGCASINIKHPMVFSKEIKVSDTEKYASVYFIRPKPYKGKGIADETIRIDFQEKLLLAIDEGSYTLLRIKPSKGQLQVFSRTKFINKSTPVEVWRAREYKFIEGKTYFIHLKRIDEEYRGIFYEPEPINLAKAKTLAVRLHASGEAGKYPIDKLENVSEPPASAVKGLSPALPENIYKQEIYLK